MKADTETAIKAFGNNEQLKKVFRTLFIPMSGMILTRALDPATAQQIIRVIMGMGI
jgi:hypothetical protein